MLDLLWSDQRICRRALVTDFLTGRGQMEPLIWPHWPAWTIIISGPPLIAGRLPSSLLNDAHWLDEGFFRWSSCQYLKHFYRTRRQVFEILAHMKTQLEQYL